MASLIHNNVSQFMSSTFDLYVKVLKLNKMWRWTRNETNQKTDKVK